MTEEELLSKETFFNLFEKSGVEKIEQEDKQKIKEIRLLFIKITEIYIIHSSIHSQQLRIFFTYSYISNRLK